MMLSTACGGVDGANDPGDGLRPANPPKTSRQLHIEDGARLYVPAPADLVTGDHRPRGAFLAETVSRLYFVTSANEPAPTERIDLHVIGTEEVEVTYARLLDDVASPFGLGAAAHFELTMPVNRVIMPGRSLGLAVRFKADTMEMQNAFLEVHTSAENMPFIRIALTGKVFHVP